MPLTHMSILAAVEMRGKTYYYCLNLRHMSEDWRNEPFVHSIIQRIVFYMTRDIN